MESHPARWHKSSFSADNGDGCVEVARTVDAGVALRDTKDRSLIPYHYTEPAWEAFVAGIRSGDFNHT